MWIFKKLLAMVIKPKKIEALDRHLKLRALGFFIIFNWFIVNGLNPGVSVVRVV